MRDPRTDPRPGDELHFDIPGQGRRTVIVDGVDEHYIAARVVSADGGLANVGRWLHIEWRNNTSKRPCAGWTLADEVAHA